MSAGKTTDHFPNYRQVNDNSDLGWISYRY